MVSNIELLVTGLAVVAAGVVSALLVNKYHARQAEAKLTVKLKLSREMTQPELDDLRTFLRSKGLGSHLSSRGQPAICAAVVTHRDYLPIWPDPPARLPMPPIAK